MDNLEEYVVSLFSRCKDPVKQVKLITELTGQTTETVVRILRGAGRIPKCATAKNYKTVLAKLPPPEVSDEMRQYIVGSPKWAETLSKELGLPLDTVVEIRREAYERVGGTYTGGGGTLKKFKAGCARHAKDAAGDGNRAGKRNCRVREKRTVGV